jgi:ribonuclease P protein component
VHSFSKEKRLRTKRDYGSVFKNAKKIDFGDLFALYKPNDQAKARLGLCISKKNCPRACDRNRIKRLIRESFRLNSPVPVDVIVLSRRGALKLDNQQILTQLQRIWDKLKRSYGMQA